MDNNPVTLQKPSDKTLKQIDFVIQGLENGKYKEISKAVEFHQKLKGDDDPTYITSLWEFIESQQRCIHDLQIDRDTERNKAIDAETRITDLESKVNNYNTDMRGVANALLTLSNPDPLGQNYNLNVDTSSAESFVNEYKNKY